MKKYLYTDLVCGSETSERRAMRRNGRLNRGKRAVRKNGAGRDVMSCGCSHKGMIVTVSIFTKLKIVRETFLKISCTEFNENLAKV